MSETKYVGKCGHVHCGNDFLKFFTTGKGKDYENDMKCESIFPPNICPTCNKLWTIVRKFEEKDVSTIAGKFYYPFSEKLPIEMYGLVFSFFAETRDEAITSFLICKELTQYLRNNCRLYSKLSCSVDIIRESHTLPSWDNNTTYTQIIYKCKPRFPSSPQLWVRRLVIEGEFDLEEDVSIPKKLSSYFPNLLSLEIQENTSKPPQGFLEGLENLKKLEVFSSHVDISIETLSSMKNLEYLLCREDLLTKSRFVLPVLKELRVIRSTIGKVKLKIVAKNFTKIYTGKTIIKNDKVVISDFAYGNKRDIDMGCCGICKNHTTSSCIECDASFRTDDSFNLCTNTIVYHDSFTGCGFAPHSHCFKRWFERRDYCPWCNKDDFCPSNHLISDFIEWKIVKKTNKKRKKKRTKFLKK